MRIEKYAMTNSQEDSFLVILEKSAESMILSEFSKALEEAARYYVEKNMDRITAKLDMQGLGNLIAVYASKKLAENMK